MNGEKAGPVTAEEIEGEITGPWADSDGSRWDGDLRARMVVATRIAALVAERTAAVVEAVVARERQGYTADCDACEHECSVRWLDGTPWCDHCGSVIADRASIRAYTPANESNDASAIADAREKALRDEVERLRAWEKAARQAMLEAPANHHSEDCDVCALGESCTFHGTAAGHRCTCYLAAIRGVMERKP